MNILEIKKVLDANGTIDKFRLLGWVMIRKDYDYIQDDEILFWSKGGDYHVEFDGEMFKYEIGFDANTAEACPQWIKDVLVRSHGGEYVNFTDLDYFKKVDNPVDDWGDAIAELFWKDEMGDIYEPYMMNGKGAILTKHDCELLRDHVRRFYDDVQKELEEFTKEFFKDEIHVDMIC